VAVGAAQRDRRAGDRGDLAVLNAIVWYPPPGLGTTALPCTAPNSPPRAPGPPKANGPPPGARMCHGPLGGKDGLTEGDGDGDALLAEAAGCPDELVAATATPAPARIPRVTTPARTANRREPCNAVRRLGLPGCAS
jgi:hypothetical protein